MRRLAAGLLILASCKDPGGGPAPAASAAPPIPGTDGWQAVASSAAKVRLRLPPGATLPEDKAGFDAAFAGSFFHVFLPGGGDVFFAERHGTPPVDLAGDKRAYEKRQPGKVTFLYEAPDALVVRREDPADAGAGTFCETTACGKVDGRTICATAQGARFEGPLITKLSDDQCFAIVAVARSLATP